MKKILFSLLFFGASLFVTAQKKYTSGELRTIDSYLYGRFEVKMKPAAGSGIVSSLFTFYDQPDFVSNWNEIDIEFLGRYDNEVQYNAIVGRHSMHEKRYELGFNPHADFHVYAFDWTPDYIAWYVDGKEVYRQEGEHVKQMNKAQKIMMNLWVTNIYAWTGPWDESILPVYAQYDFVKYYEYTPEKSEKFSLKWADEFDRFDAARWQTATHSFNENLCQFDPYNVVVKGGLMTLSITKAEEIKKPMVDEFYSNTSKVNITEAVWVEKKGKYIVRLKFSEPVNKINAKIENYKVDGMVIEKSWMGMDLQTVELYFSTLPDLSKVYQLEFINPKPENSKEQKQLIEIKK